MSVPLYATSTADQVRHIVRDSGSKLIFVDGKKDAEMLAGLRADLPDLVEVISLTAVDGFPSLDDELAAAPSDTSAVEARIAVADPDALATIIYTSGTTGEPKV